MAAMHEQQLSEGQKSMTPGTPRAVQPSTLLLIAVVALVSFVLFRGEQRPAARTTRTTDPVTVATGQAAPQASEPLRSSATKSAAAAAGEAKIRQSLENEVDLDYSDRPLDEALVDIARQLAIPLKLDTETLAD